MSLADLPHFRATVVQDAHAELGEGPHWDGARGELVWVDIMAGVVHRLDPATGTDRAFAVGQPVGAAIPRRQGGLVLALRDGIATVEDDGSELTWLSDVERDIAGNRMNDAKCDRQGRLWAGTMDLACAAPTGSLYRLAPAGPLKTMVAGVTISNGLDWSHDGSLFYFVDTATRGVDVFDYDEETGAIANRRRLISLEEGAGDPDGLTLDTGGNIWLALWEGWAVRCYSPDGTLREVVDVPAARVTSCAFGGDELATLFITSATPDEPDPRQPNAGGVFEARPGAHGVPANDFAG